MTAFQDSSLCVSKMQHGLLFLLLPSFAICLIQASSAEPVSVTLFSFAFLN